MSHGEATGKGEIMLPLKSDRLASAGEPSKKTGPRRAGKSGRKRLGKVDSARRYNKLRPRP